MLFDKSEKLNVISHARSHSGIKICYENINRRTTDVLNAKGNILSIDPIKNKIIRNRAYEKINNYIENSLRSRSPYFAGQKNKEYISKNLTTSDFLFSVTNPEAKNNNYQELMHKVQVYKNKSDNNSEDNQPFNFFKPESAFISNKNDLSNRRGLNRSYIANNSINLLKDKDLQNRSAINAGSNELCLNFKFNVI